MPPSDKETEAPGTAADADALRDLFVAANERDFARAMAHYAPDVELVIESGLRAGTYSGRDVVGAWFGDWYSSFAPGARFDVRELHELGAGSILVVLHHSATGRASGAEIHGEVVWIYRMRDAKIVRIEGFDSREAGFTAAGVDPGEPPA